MDSSRYGRPTRNSAQDSCIIEFDGASKGNPGRAGAGAVVRDSHDNSVLYRVREGLGTATNNVAEYRALNRGLEFALDAGFKNVHVQGDSQLICKQVQGEWKASHPQMAELRNQARELSGQFRTFDIQHVGREFNAEADAQANQAVNLAEGQVQEETAGAARRRGY